LLPPIVYLQVSVAGMVLQESQKELIEGCQRGDSEAFRALFEKYKDAVYSIALRYAGEPAAAQDIAQDTFLKLFSTIGSYRGESAFEPWLYRMVVNSCLDQKRRKRRWAPLLDEVLSLLRTPDLSALDQVLRSEMSAQVRGVIDGLAPEQRIVVVLRYTQGLSYEEIAEILGCAPGTVASRLNRAHKILERRLAGLAARRRKNG